MLVMSILFRSRKMDVSTIRGFAFFGLLFVTSLLLSPGALLAVVPREFQVWVVRNWTTVRTRAVIGLAVAFAGLSIWLIYSVRPAARLPLPVSKNSSSIAGMRAWK